MPRSLKASTWWLALILTPLVSVLSSSPKPSQPAAINETRTQKHSLVMLFVMAVDYPVVAGF